MKKLTVEEKAVIRAYIKMSEKKEWGIPTNYELAELIDNFDQNIREQIDLFVLDVYTKMGKAVVVNDVKTWTRVQACGIYENGNGQVELWLWNGKIHKLNPSNLSTRDLRILNDIGKAWNM